MPRFKTIQEVIDSLEENFKEEEAAGVTGVFQLSYSGDGGGDWYLDVNDGKLKVNEGITEDPDVTVSSTAEDWLDIANGKENPMMMMMKGKLKIKGSIQLATKLQTLFF